MYEWVRMTDLPQHLCTAVVPTTLHGSLQLITYNLDFTKTQTDIFFLKKKNAPGRERERPLCDRAQCGTFIGREKWKRIWKREQGESAETCPPFWRSGWKERGIASLLKGGILHVHRVQVVRILSPGKRMYVSCQVPRASQSRCLNTINIHFTQLLPVGTNARRNQIICALWICLCDTFCQPRAKAPEVIP